MIRDKVCSMGSDKTKYTEFIRTRDDICIYNMPFWLDAACGKDNWDAIVVEENREIVAAVPYHKKTRFGIRGVLQPQLTKFFEIWTKPVEGIKKERALHYQFKWLSEIAMRLKELGADYYDQNYSGSLQNLEPFAWEGFDNEVRYTFVIRPGQRIEDIELQMNSRIRTAIRSASEVCSIGNFDDTDLFYDLQDLSFTRKGIKDPVSRELFEGLYRACLVNNAGRLVAVRNKKGGICCAGFYVFDHRYVYELLLGRGTENTDCNYKAFMTHEMIRYACETERGFDFDGSMIRSIAEHNRRFGAEPVQYYRMRKITTKSIWKKNVLSYFCT